MSARDRRRLARHLSYCQPCRRYARRSGVDVDVAARPTVAARLRALLPFPFLLRGRRSSGDVPVGAPSPDAPTSLAHWSAAVSTNAEPLGSGLSKIATAAATLAVAAVGSGVGLGGKSTPFAPGAEDGARPAPAIQATRSGGDKGLMRPAGAVSLGRLARSSGPSALVRVGLTPPGKSASGNPAGRRRAGARDDRRRTGDRGESARAPAAGGDGSPREAKQDAGAQQEGARQPGVELPRVPTPEPVRRAGEAIGGAVKPATDTLTAVGGAQVEGVTQAVEVPVAPPTVAVPAAPDVGAVVQTVKSATGAQG